MELKTSEHLIYYMKHNLRLSRYDLKFLENLETIIQHENRVTTNQVALLHKIVNTYSKQFIKHQMFIDALIALPWDTTVVESIAEYVDTYIAINNGMITCKAPYHRNFIQSLNKSTDHNFKWNNDEKLYNTAFGAGNLKFIVETTKKHFNNIHHCTITTQLLEELYEFENITHWQPTLVYINEMLLIAAMNSSLNDAVAHIQLDFSPVTLSELVRYGIVIDSSVVNHCDSAIVNFAAQYSPVVELSDLLDIVPWLEELNCDFVYLSGGPSMTTNKAAFKKLLKTANISCHQMDDFESAFTATTFKYPVIIRFRTVTDMTQEPCKVAKVIKLVDSRPITIR